MITRKLFGASVLLLICLKLAAGDYQCFYPERISYYTTSSGMILAVRIDSLRVTGSGDTIMYPFYTMQQLDYDCFSPNVSSWIGKEIIIRQGGIEQILNIEGDTITIHTQSVLDEQWVCYSGRNQYFIEARVIDQQPSMFHGVADTMKTISFTAKDTSGTIIDHIINDKVIRLTRSHGLSTTLNFSNFPDIENFTGYYTNYWLYELNLSGITNPDLGVQNFSWLEANDFMVGEEFHYAKLSSRYGPWGSDYSLNEKIIREILDKSVGDHEFTYRIMVTREIQGIYDGNPLDSISVDTITEYYKQNEFFNHLPEEPVYPDAGNITVTLMRNRDGRTTKFRPACMDYGEYKGCWYMPVCDGCFPEYEYAKGLGTVFYECYSSFEGNVHLKYDLVYYKKEEKTWGTPLVINDIPAYNILKGRVYPNPFQNILAFEVQEFRNLAAYFRLFDIKGKLVFSFHKITHQTQYLDLGFLSSGIYFYVIESEGRLIDRGKLIKQE